MSLQLYLSKEHIPKGSNIIYINDVTFNINKSHIKIDNKVVELMRNIDGSEYINGTLMKTRFGEYLDMRYSSTGCKTAINVYTNPDSIVDCIECGSNAISEILKLTNGAVIVKSMPSRSEDCLINVVLNYKGKKKSFSSLFSLLDICYRLEDEN